MWPLAIAVALGGALLLFGSGASPVRRVPNAFPPLGKPRAARVTSRFGPRKDPFTGLPGKAHEGIDLGVPEGTPIYAPVDGIVTRVDQDGVPPWGVGNGNAVRILGDGYAWSFMHLKVPMVGVRQAVYRGQIIGLSGSTGRATGPHLHLQTTEVQTGHAVDPEKVYPEGTF